LKNLENSAVIVKSNHRVLIGKPLQLEKMDTAKSKMDAARRKITSAKAFCSPARH
jgi:hypothetical protein